jgi:hypothetical protein
LQASFLRRLLCGFDRLLFSTTSTEIGKIGHSPNSSEYAKDWTEKDDADP